MTPVALSPDHPDYPARLNAAPGLTRLPTLTVLGDRALLQANALALLCSREVPPRPPFTAEALLPLLVTSKLPIISGFHAPLEKACLAGLMQSGHPTIQVLARGLDGLRLTPAQTTAIAAGRLVIVSPFSAHQRRASVALAQRRNRVVTAIAIATLVPYAAPNSKASALVQALAENGSRIFTLEDSETATLHALGAIAATLQSLVQLSLTKPSH